MRTEPDCDYDKCVIICDSHGSDRKTFEVMTSTWSLGTLGSAAGMLLHINGKFTMGKLKSSLLS
jgi:hypothetical protein